MHSFGYFAGEHDSISASSPSSASSTSTASSTPTADQRADSNFADFVSVAKQKAMQYGIVEIGTDSIVVLVVLEPVTAKTVYRLAVFKDFTWQLEYRGHKLEQENTHVLSNWPQQLGSDSLDLVIRTLLQTPVCTGHTDLSKLLDQCAATGTLVSHDRKTVFAFYLDGSVRSPKCTILMMEPAKTGLCEACGQSDFRNNLRARESYLRKEKCPTSSKFTNNVYLTESGKVKKLKAMSQTVRKLKKKVKVLGEKVEEMFQTESVQVDEMQHELLMKVVKENEKAVCSEFADGSAQRLLWEQQVKRQKVKSAKGMRWHPTLIRWCISMFAKSPAAYRQLAESGFLHLPSRNTLKSYINFTQSLPDVNPDVLQLVAKEFDLPHAAEFKTNVTLVWDEIRIKSGLAVAKGSGKIIGFCSLDNVNEELEKLSDVDRATAREPELATHIIVFMVRGIMCKANLPFLWYPCAGFNADQLWGVVWKATRTLECLGLRVRAWTCDGASSNRKFFQMHEAVGVGTYQGITYSIVNRYDHDRVIYFICDAPHLIKTVRNNLENSHGNQNSKSLMKDGISISWSHITSTVEEDLSRGLVRLPKLKEEHIRLSPQLRMRVGLAAQVLSNSMAKALLARDQPQFSKTAEFCQMFDRWFDCLNGRQRYGPKSDLNAYDSVTDVRFVWLADGFLGWLDSWEREIQSLNLSKSEMNRHLLSYQTSQGLKITTKSFISLSQEVLSEPGADFLMPEKLNQDRLEVFFAKLRRTCGDSDNPTVEEARHRILALLVAGRSILAPRRANSVVDEETELNFFMPRRKMLRRE